MTDDVRTQVTGIVARLGEGETGHAASAEELAPLVYNELRRLAASYLRRERPGHTLRPTDLVHEAYLKLVDQTRVNWQGRTHFFAVGAQVMRRLLIDHARKRYQDKRGGGWQRVTLTDAPGESELAPEELLAIDTALTKLAELDQRQAKIVELRYFAGFSVEEVAELLGVSKRTVEGDWTHARAWLKRELAG